MTIAELFQESETITKSNLDFVKKKLSKLSKLKNIINNVTKKFFI
jgi:hypothetical protein